VKYDVHSWGRAEGSTVSARFVQLLFNRCVVPRLGWDYEVLTVFVQHSDEFAGISPELLAALCRGASVVALYFLWPVQGQQTYGDKLPCTAAYVDSTPFFEMVARMEACGIVTCWPHHSQLWRCLASKEWLPSLSVVPKFHVPPTTRVPKSLIILDPRKAAEKALATLRLLQAEKYADDSYAGPSQCDWAAGDGDEQCVVKLGFSYEGVDVRMVQGVQPLCDALYSMATQPGYSSDCVYVQQRVQQVDLEARCFVVQGRVVESLYTRFARVDAGGYVRDYEKALGAEDALREWFHGDAAAWQEAEEQVRALTRRWQAWLLAQCAEPPASLRIDYLLARVGPGRAEVWTCELGEQGYSLAGMDPARVLDAVLDGVPGCPPRRPASPVAGAAGASARLPAPPAAPAC